MECNCLIPTELWACFQNSANTHMYRHMHTGHCLTSQGQTRCTGLIKFFSKRILRSSLAKGYWNVEKRQEAPFYIWVPPALREDGYAIHAIMLRTGKHVRRLVTGICGHFPYLTPVECCSVVFFFFCTWNHLLFQSGFGLIAVSIQYCA